MYSIYIYIYTVCLADYNDPTLCALRWITVLELA